MNIQITKVREGARLPKYGSAYAAGADLYACLDRDVETTETIPAGETRMIPTGIALALPEGYAGLIYARSGLASKSGLAPANKVGVVDCDYRGEVIVALHNHSKETQTVSNGDRIAQLVITPYITAVFDEVEKLPETERGTGGFGSTGKN
ncbi:MAG: dUTP diphosphatase [Clostridia bacterium]|nr:dUTP diphosphatase [Clostridia bacterium]